MATSYVRLASFALLLVASFSFVDAVKDKNVEIRLEVGKPYFTAHYKEAGAKNDDKPPVLVLHAGLYSSEKWQESGTIDALAQAGAYVVAVDLPSYGKTDGDKLYSAEDRVKFLQAFLAAVKLEKVLIVSAGYGGTFAVPFISSYPDRVVGYITASGIGLEEAGHELLKRTDLTLPVLVVWGGKNYPQSTAVKIYSWVFPNSELTIFENGGINCYLEESERFNDVVVNFYQNRL